MNITGLFLSDNQFDTYLQPFILHTPQANITIQILILKFQLHSQFTFQNKEASLDLPLIKVSF